MLIYSQCYHNDLLSIDLTCDSPSPHASGQLTMSQLNNNNWLHASIIAANGYD